MKITDMLNMDLLAKHVTERTVNIQSHPASSLRIANYTQRCQFAEAWDEVSMQCRGLIFDSDTMTVVARPWRKFWNLGDTRFPETLGENLPSALPVVTRKLDGSLGISYELDGRHFIATRGSFISDQAQWATRWMSEHHPALAMPEGFTALWEIVYQDNRIVVRYEWEGLVCLGLIGTETGEELPPHEARQWADSQGVHYIEVFDKPLDVCAKEDGENEEGYVATWLNAGRPPLKVKIKYSTYSRIHKILTGTSIVGIWELLREGKNFAALRVGMPEEFCTWVDEVETRLRRTYRSIEVRAKEVFDAYPGTISAPRDGEQRKRFAAYAVQQQPLTPLLFTLLDKGNPEPMIWKMIRPKGDDTTFKKDVE